MHIDDSNSDLLKPWVTNKLAQISDADSDVLADYVLALVKTDDPDPVAKATCVESLQDFLHGNTVAFVNELFQAITTKSYDPSRPQLRPTAFTFQPTSGLPKHNYTDLPRLPNESRKRAYHHNEDGELAANGLGRWQRGGRPSKQPRRGDRGSEARGGRHVQATAQPRANARDIPQLGPLLPGMPPVDPTDQMGMLLQMQQTLNAMMAAMSGAQFGSQHRPTITQRRPQRCRDYDLKGFCNKGASCPYDHSNEPTTMGAEDEEYDPNNAMMVDIEASQNNRLNAAGSSRGGGGEARRGGLNDNTRRRGAKRADISHAGPLWDPTATRIVVEQIPLDRCNDPDVRAFFGQFGEIENIELQRTRKLAIVTYTDHDGAQAAYDSPKVVFDNRFVKVYWYNEDSHSGMANGHGDVEMGGDGEVDLEEIAKRQEEAQRKYEETRAQRQEVVKKRQELSLKLREIETERARMEAALKKRLNGHSGSDDSSDTFGEEENEQTKALKAQLASLEAEAKSLGIDPDAPTTNGYGTYPPQYRGRGGYRDRGRGRGHYTGYRGGWAGGASRGGAVMRLDNRPKTVAVAFASGTSDEHDEAIRQFLLFNSMDHASISKHPERDDVALVTFEQRFEGENFMDAIAGSELPHTGKVELSWYKPGDEPRAVNGSPEQDEGKVVIRQTPELPTSELAAAAEQETDGQEEDLDQWG